MSELPVLPPDIFSTLEPLTLPLQTGHFCSANHMKNE